MAAALAATSGAELESLRETRDADRAETASSERRARDAEHAAAAAASAADLAFRDARARVAAAEGETARHLGVAVHVEPMKSMLKASGTERLKLTYVNLLSSFAFNVNLRRCIWVLPRRRGRSNHIPPATSSKRSLRPRHSSCMTIYDVTIDICQA
jgi:hypothetical protein